MMPTKASKLVLHFLTLSKSYPDYVDMEYIKLCLSWSEEGGDCHGEILMGRFTRWVARERRRCEWPIKC